MEKELAKQRIHERKVKKALKTYRCRWLKNLLLWFTGVLTSFAIIAIGIFVAVKVLPLKTYTGNKTDNILSEEIATKSLLDAVLGYKNYSIGDLPVVENALKELINGSGLDAYMEVDFDKLNNVKFVYETDETNIMTELQKCIKVTATLESVGASESLGDLGKLDVFSKWEDVTSELSPVVDENGNIVKEGDVFKSNPKLYYYELSSPEDVKPDTTVPDSGKTMSSYINETVTPTYARAFDDNGVLVAPKGAKLYLPNLSKIPVLDILDIIDERMGSIKVADLLGVFGEVGADSMIQNILGDKTLGGIGTLSPADINLFSILGGEPTSEIYKILGSATAKDGVNTPYNEITLDMLTAADFSVTKVKVYDIMGGAETDTIYKILSSATGKTYTDITLDDMTGTGFTVDNVKIFDIMGGTETDTIYKILSSATGKNYADISLGDMTGSGFNITNVSLNAIVDKTGNEKFYELLYSLTGKPETEDITINDITSISDFTNIKLSSVLDYAGNEKLYDILLDVVNADKVDKITYDKLTLAHLTGFDINKLKLANVLPLSNESIYKILADATGKAGAIITIGDLSSFNINNIKLSSVLPVASNDAIYKILVDATGKSADSITITDFSAFNISNIKLSSVLDTASGSTIYKILVDATGKSADTISVGDLTAIKDFGNVKLTSVLPVNSGNQALYDMLLDVTGETSIDNIKVSSLSSFNFANVKLKNVISEASSPDLYKLLKDITGKTNAVGDEILVGDLTTFNVANIKLSSIMSSSSNSVLDALLKDPTVTVGNLGEKISSLNITALFGDKPCFTTVANGAEYKKLTGNGKTCYVISAKADSYASANGLNVDTGSYYISKSAQIWLYIQYEKLNIDGSTNDGNGYALGFMDKGLTLNTMGDSMGTIGSTVMNATLGELSLCGVIDGSALKPELKIMSIQKVIDTLNSIPMIP